MNLHLAPENLALSVAYLRNSRAHMPGASCSGRLDGKILSHKLLRPELISISLQRIIQGGLYQEILRSTLARAILLKLRGRRQTNLIHDSHT